MLARFRSLLFAINASYWFYPALFATTGFVLALVFIDLDRSGAADWLAGVKAISPARPDGASNMLTVLAGSMIGVASTVFSITIAAVAYASGTYGPRLLTNFMEDKGNQLSLATFIGTFVYAITVLRTVRSEDEAAIFSEAGGGLPGFVPQLSLLVAFVLMLVSVAVLVYFLHHIPSSIRINAVLRGIGERLLDMVDKLYPADYRDDLPCPDFPNGIAVKATNSGYVRVINYDEMNEIAEEHQLRIGLRVRTGDFVHADKPLLVIAGEADDEKVADKLRDAIALGGSRTPEQDIDFSIDELVEIALRALSPGINDPFTAVSAMHWLGAATGKLAGRQLRREIVRESEDEDPRVILAPDGFEHYLERGFGAARAALASNGIAARNALDTLASVGATVANADRRALLRRECELLLEQARTMLDGPELDTVTARHKAALETFDQSAR